MVVKQTVAHNEVTFGSGRTDHGKRTTFALTQRSEAFDVFGGNRQNVTLLRLVTPQLGRAHARIFALDGTQFKTRADTARVRQFRHGVRQPARAHVMRRQDGVINTHLPAAVDDFLRATLDFRVTPLHRGKIQIGLITARGHRRRSTAAQTDEHAGAAELHEQRAWLEAFLLKGLFGLNRTDTTRNHDRLVIAAHDVADRLFVSAEITGQIRTTKFVVEGGSTDRAFDHDVQRAGDTIRLAGRTLPRLLGIRQIQI